VANEQDSPENLGQDPYVERLRPDPSQPPEAVRVLEGLLGDSDREGYKRLYFNRELDHYAEFRAEDVVFSEQIPPDQHPFLGQQATRVGIRRDATIEYTRLRTPRPVDEFDLDIRLAAPGRTTIDGVALTGWPTQCWHTCQTCFTCNTPCRPCIGGGGGGGGGGTIFKDTVCKCTDRLDTCLNVSFCVCE
jgi:hypothetical protein